MTDSNESVSGNSPAKRRRIVNRPRPIVSCLSCRSRKLKCDREQPCQQCLRAGRATTCSYAPGPGTPPDSTTTRYPAQVEPKPSPSNEAATIGRPPIITNPRSSWRPSPITLALDSRDDVERTRHQDPADVVPVSARSAERLKIKGNRTRYSQADMTRALLQKVL